MVVHPRWHCRMDPASVQRHAPLHMIQQGGAPQTQLVRLGSAVVRVACGCAARRLCFAVAAHTSASSSACCAWPTPCAVCRVPSPRSQLETDALAEAIVAWNSDPGDGNGARAAEAEAQDGAAGGAADVALVVPDTPRARAEDPFGGVSFRSVAGGSCHPTPAPAPHHHHHHHHRCHRHRLYLWLGGFAACAPSTHALCTRAASSCHSTLAVHHARPRVVQVPRVRPDVPAKLADAPGDRLGGKAHARQSQEWVPGPFRSPRRNDGLAARRGARLSLSCLPIPRQHRGAGLGSPARRAGACARTVEVRGRGRGAALRQLARGAGGHGRAQRVEAGAQTPGARVLRCGRHVQCAGLAHPRSPP